MPDETYVHTANTRRLRIRECLEEPKNFAFDQNKESPGNHDGHYARQRNPGDASIIGRKPSISIEAEACLGCKPTPSMLRMRVGVLLPIFVVVPARKAVIASMIFTGCSMIQNQESMQRALLVSAFENSKHSTACSLGVVCHPTADAVGSVVFVR
jgi:hypothetical protein